jgi:Zn-dependent protease with chaperone function
MPPVSNGAGTVPELVAEWTLLPLLVQVTVPLVVTVIEAGAKPVSLMVTLALEGACSAIAEGTTMALIQTRAAPADRRSHVRGLIPDSMEAVG